MTEFYTVIGQQYTTEYKQTVIGVVRLENINKSSGTAMDAERRTTCFRAKVEKYMTMANAGCCNNLWVTSRKKIPVSFAFSQQKLSDLKNHLIGTVA